MNIKHLVSIFFIACLLSFPSCLKQIGKDETATTLFIGHEEIPDIRAFMPNELLLAFDSINYGIFPPWLQGDYTLDSAYQDTVLWFIDQRNASAKLRFDYNSRFSSSDATLQYFKADPMNLERFIQANSNAPYFRGKHAKDIDPEMLSRVYIIGDATDENRFTAYYYEVQDHEGESEPYQSVNAVILSGIGPDSIAMPVQTIVHVPTDTIPYDTVVYPINTPVPYFASNIVYDSLVINDSVYYFLSQIISHDSVVYMDGAVSMQIRITKWGYQTLYHIGTTTEPIGMNTLEIERLFRIPEPPKEESSK